MVFTSAILMAATDGHFAAFVVFWQETAWIWLVASVVLIMIPSWLLRGQDPVSLDASNAILDAFREALFGDSSDDDAHHRVTLFKRERRWRSMTDGSGKWQRPGSRWLVPVARSGHGSKKTRARFRCPDDTDRAEGIAGRAWARSRVVRAKRLPNLNGPDCSEEDLRRYASATYVSVEWVRKRKPAARSFVGFRVDDARSEPWGVLVIDSRRRDFDTERAREAFDTYAPVLVRLLKRI